MTEALQAVLAAVVAFAGGAGFKTLFDYLKSRDKEYGKQRLSELEMPIGQFSGITKELRDIIKELRERQSQLEADVEECHRDKSDLREEVGGLRAEVKTLKDVINQFISEQGRATTAATALSVKTAAIADRAAERATKQAETITKVTDENPLPVKVVPSDSGILKHGHKEP